MAHPKKLLILASNPRDLKYSEAIAQAKAIQDVMSKAPKRDWFDLDLKLAAQMKDLEEAMIEPPSLLHFCGHGAAEEGIVLEGENQYSYFVSPEDFDRILGPCEGTTECVVLNGCRTQPLGELIQDRVEYVICTNQTLSPSDARRFAERFYQSLGQGESIEKAYESAVRPLGPKNPFVLLHQRATWPDEPAWPIDEAAQVDRYLESIKALKAAVAKAACLEYLDLAVTLYVRSDGDYVGIGSFEYDLVYVSNLRDSTLMFGPIIPGDVRIWVTECEDASGADFYTGVPRPGGFAEREGVSACAWFKIGRELWSGGRASAGRITRNDIDGLLFVNVRTPGVVTRATFSHPRVIRALAALEKPVNELRTIRNRNKDRQSSLLNAAYRQSRQVRPLVQRAAVGCDDIAAFFSELVRIFRYEDLAFTVYRYEERPRDGGRPPEKWLHWLWSNGPTGIAATTAVPQPTDPHTEATPLPVRVASDAAHRPRLVHFLQDETNCYRQCAVYTKLGSNARAALLVPVLSNDYDETGNSRPLLGVIELQGSQNAQFNTNNVQILYEACALFVAPFMSKIAGLSALGATRPPLERRRLAFGLQDKSDFDIRDLLRLNFSPMKYLFHWEKIKEVALGRPIAFPTLVEVWPSMHCNHSCDWCRTEAERNSYFRRNEYIGRDGLLRLAEELVEWTRPADKPPVDVLISGGGEPLLNKHMHEFTALLRELRGTLGIFTNGTRPSDFRFWESFFSRPLERGSSFVRVSFNGADAKRYFQVHRKHRLDDPDFPLDYERLYNEARKLVLDLLSMRSGSCTVALGSTIHSKWLDTVPDQAEHAHKLGVDFIQMRPELVESALHKEIGDEVRARIEEQTKAYGGLRDFAVKYTDYERDNRNHDYHPCYAMHLVPTLVPDLQPGWIKVMPCSYAESQGKSPPVLGKMAEGTRLADFWQVLEYKLCGGDKAPEVKEGIQVTIDEPINPANQCPQCRYYKLNKRIIGLRKWKDDAEFISHLELITRFVECLRDNPYELNGLARVISQTWDKDVIDVQEAQKAFQIAKKLGITPSL